MASANKPRSSLLDIELDDYCNIPQQIQNLLTETRGFYNEKNFVGAIKGCDELLQYVHRGWIQVDGLLVIKLMFLMSKCHLEMDHFIAAKYFLDKTYQLILSICPGRIHDLDPFLIEIEERQGNIVGAFILSILFREVNFTENEDKLNKLKAQLASSMAQIDIINKVFHPLFETAKVYLNDDEPSLAAAIFEELMQILQNMHCDESFKSNLMNRVRLNRKLALSKVDAQFHVTNTHRRNHNSPDTAWEGLPPKTSFYDGWDDDVEFVVHSAPLSVPISHDMTVLYSVNIERQSTSSGTMSDLPGNGGKGKKRESPNVEQCVLQAKSKKQKEKQSCFPQRQSLSVPPEQTKRNVASDQSVSSNAQSFVAQKQSAKIPADGEQEENVMSGSMQSQLPISQPQESTPSGTKPGNANTQSQPASVSTYPKKAMYTCVPQYQAGPLKFKPRKAQDGVAKIQNTCSSDSKVKLAQSGEPFEVQPDLLGPNRFNLLSTRPPQSQSPDDEENSTSEENYSESTRDETMDESTADTESVSETSEVSSTCEGEFQTVHSKKKKKPKSVDLPSGVEVICEHFQANPSNVKVCKGCETKCFFAFFSIVSHRWERVRPYPKYLDNTIEFHHCFYYDKEKPCNNCRHPHGPEKTMWDMERQRVLPPPERFLKTATGSTSSKSKKKRSGKKRKKKATEAPQQVTTSQPIATVSGAKLPQYKPSQAQHLQQNVCYLPKNVSLVCRHFMDTYGGNPIGMDQRRNACKFCITNRAGNHVRYAFWSAKFKKWFLVRPRPTNVQPNTAFQDCKQFIRGENCRKIPCTFGHGPEVMVWTMEREGVLVPPRKAFYSTIQDESMNRDSMIRPLTQTDGDFRLCLSVHSRIPCRFGRGCRNAHSEEELFHWQDAYKEKVLINTSQRQQQQQYNQQQHQQQHQQWHQQHQHQQHQQQYQQQQEQSSDKVVLPRQEPYETAETLPGVTLSCNPENSNVILTETGDIHQHEWTFCIRYKMEKELKHPMFFLGKRHSGYFRLKSVRINEIEDHSMSKQPPKSCFKDLTTEKLLHFKPSESVLTFLDSLEIEMVVVVEFRAPVFGSFAQSILFDFGCEPLLIKEFNIDVLGQGMNEMLKKLTSAREELSKVTLSFDESDIVRMETNEEESKLFVHYSLPKDAERIVSAQMVDESEKITPDYYVQVMHQLLFAEEAHMKNLLSRLIPSGAMIKVAKSFFDESKGLTTAIDGDFFGTIELQTNITPDDMAGRVCTRKVQSILLQPRGEHTHLYEAPIEVLKEDMVIVKLFPRLCQDLKIKREGQEIDIQMWFNLNRTIMCRMHRALDMLTETHKRLLFPIRQSIIRRKEIVPSWLINLDNQLNENQLRVISAITEIQSPSAPLVVFGPFGTGKTHTLNRAILHLVTKQNNRVLVCTHTNSAADIHVKLLDEYLNKYKMSGANPLRIYDPGRKVATVSQLTRKYCLIEHDAFALPSRQDINKHQVVITTLITADLLTKLDVRHGFFTHILIDEAAQAWETEAVIPIALAGPNSKIVFTGDHMQMSPEVYTKFACQYGLQKSLPERLFDHYSQMETDTTDSKFQDNHVMFLKDNYRSNSEILQFPSDNFYGGSIVAMGDEENPAHPDFGPLMFFTSRGKDVKQHDNTYLNAAEVSEVVKRVNELVQSWPECWGIKKLKDIAVLAPYKYQVQAIRGELRKAHLGKVTVDTIHNVQGMEFRALFISTVRTRESIKDLEESHENLSLEFLSDPKLLVTAVTRAKSFVAVVGDPVSLCTLGECSYLWGDFIRRCSILGKLHGITMKELMGEVNACTDLTKKLNPEAPTFVPRSSTATERGGNQEIKEEQEEESEGNDEQSSTCSGDADDELEDENPFKELELKIYDPPRHFDKIVEAFIKKAKASKEEVLSSLELPTEEPAEYSKTARESDYNGLKSRDYEMQRINGREEIRLIGLYPERSERAQRTLDYSNNFSQDLLSPDVLQQMIKENPSKFLIGQLRVSFESKTSYVEFPDKTKPDVKIRGDVRQAFDRDTVVIDIDRLHPEIKEAFDQDTAGVHYEQDFWSNKSSKCDCVIGVLDNLINPRERQYVCKLDENSHSLMVPINKSIPKIVNLSDKSCRKIPIYKKVANNKKRPYKVQRMMDPVYAKRRKFLFVVKFLQWRSDCYCPLGIALRTITQGESVEDCIRIADAEHGARRARRREVEREAEASFPANWKIPSEERQRRKKVTNAFTIDPEESKDLDDAVSIDRFENKSYRIGVHIADVSYFVRPGSKVDEDARQRGTTYYPGIPDFENIPMLPRSLSENHCSLLENKDRLTQTVYIVIDSEGDVLEYPVQIESTITRSRCQLTYSEAQRIIEGNEPERGDPEVQELLQESIPLMHSLAQKLRRRRVRAINHSDKRDDVAAHELIEELMILANRAVGRILYTHENKHSTTPFVSNLEPKVHRLNKWAKDYGKFAKYHPFMNRYLDGEDIQADVREMLDGEGDVNIVIFQPIWNTILKSKSNGSYAMLPFLIGRPDCSPQLQLANLSLRRIHSRAEYKCAQDHEAVSHHGLAVNDYVHFTSPIRRYMDIEIHRRLKSEEERELEEVEKFCRRSTFIKDNARKFGRECQRISYAHKLKKCNEGLEVIVDELDRHSFVLHARDSEQDLFSHHNNRISYQDLSLYDEPGTPDDNHETTLTWRVRIYKSPTEKENNSDGRIPRPQYREKELMEGLLISVAPYDTVQVVHQVKGRKWLQLIEASNRENNAAEIDRLVDDIVSDHQERTRSRHNAIIPSQYVLQNIDVKPFDNEGHYYTIAMKLKQFDVVHVQLFPRLSVSVLTPDIQLFKISSNFDICVEHLRLPRLCFARSHHENASKDRPYNDIDDYIHHWKPVLAMEVANQAVSQNEGFVLKCHRIIWSRQDDGKIEGNFSLKESYCMHRQLDFKFGDLACVRIPKIEDQSTLDDATSKNKDTNRARSIWVGHCVFRKVEKKTQSHEWNATLVVNKMASAEMPEMFLDGKVHSCDLEVIHVPVPLRRMNMALTSKLKESTELVQSICCGWRPIEKIFKIPHDNLSLADHCDKSGFQPLNEFQLKSVKKALRTSFSLIQGPPGTGKTVTGVHIAYWFTKQNLELEATEEPDTSVQDKEEDGTDKHVSNAPPQVLYCGPSNKSVDVVTEYLLRIPGMKDKILRVYGSMIEETEFPIPNKVLHLKPHVSDDELKIPEGELKEVSLHHVIRSPLCPYSSDLEKFETEFREAREKKVRPIDESVKAYCKVISDAEQWAVETTGKQIILCTCSRSGSKVITEKCNIAQCIVDECGMCMEPEILVPLTSSQAKQIVLIGDHKQLQPIVTERQAARLGLVRSMFERLHKEAEMLRIQYRMHSAICAFPSSQFYDSQLRTDETVKARKLSSVDFWPAASHGPIVFCHVDGEEKTSVIATSESGADSKYNEKEANKAVQVAKYLVNKYGINKTDVVILSPYREQRKRIADQLKGAYDDIRVTTIIKSQGSEWDYVIISLVRSLPKDDIDPEPSFSWLSEHLGFIRDEHQINVALTRAKNGLCIIGNKNLISLDKTWYDLLQHYKEKDCIVEEWQWPESIYDEENESQWP